MCETFLLGNITVSNCISAHNCATTYLCHQLQNETRDFILANFIAVAQSDDFLNLSYEQVEEWISHDKVIVNGEEDVFGVIVNCTKVRDCRISKYQKASDIIMILSNLDITMISYLITRWYLDILILS